MLTLSTSFGHEARPEFIPSACCSYETSEYSPTPDCKPLEPKSVKHINGYYAIIDRANAEVLMKIPESEATPSNDGRYWICLKADGSIRNIKDKLCFFAPPEGN